MRKDKAYVNVARERRQHRAQRRSHRGLPAFRRLKWVQLQTGRKVQVQQ